LFVRGQKYIAYKGRELWTSLTKQVYK